MKSEKVIALLVAEKSLIDIIEKSIQGLLINSNVYIIYLVVPNEDVTLFRAKINNNQVHILSENDLISSEKQILIKERLGKMHFMYGWYLQQFLKFEFAHHIDQDNYLIWDADTVLFKKMVFKTDIFEVVPSSEYHKPYFETLEKILGIQRQVNFSFISQFMMVNKNELNDFFSLIDRESPQNWYLRVIENIKKDAINEFSEYESYGNYIAFKNKRSIKLKHKKWFRYGAAVYNFKNLKKYSFRDLKNKFSGYTFVAFERHKYSFFKRFIAKIIVFLKL